MTRLTIRRITVKEMSIIVQIQMQIQKNNNTNNNINSNDTRSRNHDLIYSNNY